MDDDFASLRQRVLLESAETRTRLDEIHALSEQAIDAHAMLSHGLQIVTTQSARTDEKIDDLRDGAASTRRAVDTLRAEVHTDLKWVKVLVVLMLAWQIGSSVLSTAPAKAMIAAVAR